jgi:adenylate cyclase
MAFVAVLAGCLIVIQIATFEASAKAAASAAMDAASANTLSRLDADVAALSSLVRILAINPSLTEVGDRGQLDGAVGLFKAALRELPQTDSIHVGFEDGSWLQVRRLTVLDQAERRRLEAPDAATYNINLARSGVDSALPMRRIFQDDRGNTLAQLDLPDYGFDVRNREWYRNTLRADQPTISPPYLSFSIGTPMISVSAPLGGRLQGVIAADLKLDTFSDLVNAQRPGEHGTAIVFDSFGTLIAHPDFVRLVERASTNPSHVQLPEVTEIRTGLTGTVMRKWDGSDRFEGVIQGEDGEDYLFRIRKFSQRDGYSGYSLLIAAEADFASEVRKLQIRGILIALFAGACFIPLAWLFGGRMAVSLKLLTRQTARLQLLAAPEDAPVTSRIAEIHELGRTLAIAQRTIWSFAHFVAADVVKGIIDGSISTELGGVRQEVTIVFTDVSNFTGIAEVADPNLLMRQTSRHLSALTEAFLAEGGTVDKFIGDSVMVFWNAPRRQLDHVERACRAALSAKAASDALNREFESEGWPPFAVRLGVHVGDAVVGNVGSVDRMEYTVLGNSVNLAARLEGLNKEYGTAILVSEAVRDRIADRFCFNSLGSTMAKGMTVETRVYELVGTIEADGPNHCT